MNRLIRPVVWTAAVSLAYCWWRVESLILEHLVFRGDR